MKVIFFIVGEVSVNEYLSGFMQVRRQLEYSIAHSKGIALVRPPGTVQAVREIFRANGLCGLYTGFRLHFSASLLSEFDVLSCV